MYDRMGDEGEIIRRLKAALWQADEDLAFHGGQSKNDSSRIKIREALNEKQ